MNRGGSSAGTPNYLSPEQFEQKAIDEKVDVFAFGTLVWELFTEQVPYEGLDVADMRKATCSGKDLPMGLSVPKSIQVLIKKCRELVPGDRPSLTEVCKELQALLN